MTPPVSLVLLHHPVRDRSGATITTAVTNLDVHDIARSARTYELERYYIVTPIGAQQALVERILEHWRTGPGVRRVPERAEALARCEVRASLDAVVDDLRERHGARPLLFVTSARAPAGRPAIGYAEARARMAEASSVIVFGTGHGLADAVVQAADHVIRPIQPGGAYNHLSVRAAVAITLDRLFGEGRERRVG